MLTKYLQDQDIMVQLQDFLKCNYNWLYLGHYLYIITLQYRIIIQKKETSLT